MPFRLLRQLSSPSSSIELVVIEKAKPKRDLIECNWHPGDYNWQGGYYYHWHAVRSDIFDGVDEASD